MNIQRESWVVACHLVKDGGQIWDEAVWTEEVCLPLVRSTQEMAIQMAIAMRNYKGMKYTPSSRHILVAVKL